MIRYFLIFFLSFISLGAFSQVEKDTLSPVLKFEKTFIDLGDLNEGQNAEYLFDCENISKDTLVIEVYSSCGCVAPICKNKIIPPGGKGQVGFSFNSNGRPGLSNKCIYVRVNGRSYTRLCFRVNVIPKKK